MKYTLLFFSIFLAVVAIAYLLPASFYVQINSVKYHDMCIGEQVQLVTAQRDVHWTTTGYAGHVKGELFNYEGIKKIETIIKREIDFVYQVQKEPITYEIRWSEPINKAGQYGASDLITIEPFLFKKEIYMPEDTQTFNVIDCTI